MAVRRRQEVSAHRGLPARVPIQLPTVGASVVPPIDDVSPVRVDVDGPAEPAKVPGSLLGQFTRQLLGAFAVSAHLFHRRIRVFGVARLSVSADLFDRITFTTAIAISLSSSLAHGTSISAARTESPS